MNVQDAAPGGANLADKKLAISTGLLALALGSSLGTTPAEAKLITTTLDHDVLIGESYNFGPVGDTDAFTFTNFGFVNITGLPPDDCGCEDLFPVVTLKGNETALSKNFVAVKAGTGPIISIVFPGLPTADDLLDYYGPGDHISDASSDFAISGQDIFFEPTYDFIYGLKSVAKADPFGYVQFDILADGDDSEFVHLDKVVFQDVAGADAVVGVPEPGTLSLFAVGGAALLAARRRKKQQKTA